MDMVGTRQVVVTGPGPLHGHIITMDAREAAILVAQRMATYITPQRVQHAVQTAREDMMRRN